jgi:hypothetical protein
MADSYPFSAHFNPPTFTMVHEGPSHGYNYNLYHTIGNVPPLTFAMVHEGPSHGYDYNPYCTIGNILPPIFGPQVTTCDMDEEDFLRQPEEATRQGQEDYI